MNVPQPPSSPRHGPEIELPKNISNPSLILHFTVSCTSFCGLETQVPTLIFTSFYGPETRDPCGVIDTPQTAQHAANSELTAIETTAQK